MRPHSIAELVPHRGCVRRWWLGVPRVHTRASRAHRFRHSRRGDRGNSGRWCTHVDNSQRLRDHLHADTASYGWFDLRSGECQLITWPDVADVRLMMSSTVRTPRSHPVLGHWLAGHSDVAVVSELVTDWHAWRKSEGYDLLRRGIGCTETGGIRLDSGRESLRMVGLARGVNFSCDEIQLLRDICQPTIAITAHADWVTTIGANLGTGSRVISMAAELSLTTRELEVLHHLATGMLATSIGSRMHISTRTVHRHLSSIYRKLGTHDRLTTVLIAQEAGLVRAGRAIDC